MYSSGNRTTATVQKCQNDKEAKDLRQVVKHIESREAQEGVQF